MAQQFSSPPVPVQTGEQSGHRRRSFRSWGFAISLAATFGLELSCARSPAEAPPSSPPTADAAPSKENHGNDSSPPVVAPSGVSRPLALVRRVEIRVVDHLSQALPSSMKRESIRRKALPLAYPHNTWLALDQHPPRFSKGRRLRLVDLINEDEEVAPGTHSLTLIRSVSDHIEVQSHPFSIDTDLGKSGDPVDCVLFQPAGTYNGEKASEMVEFLALPIGLGAADVEYEVASLHLDAPPPWRAHGTFKTGEIAGVSLASGDFRVTATCRNGAGIERRMTRTITVNRDAAVESKK